MKPFKEENTAYGIVFLSGIFQLVLAVGWGFIQLIIAQCAIKYL